MGLLASIAVPVFNYQRQLAVDAQTVSDVRNAASAVERWQSSNLLNNIDKSTDITSTDNPYGIRVSKGTELFVKKGPENYTFLVCGYNPQGSSYRTAAQASSYNSYAGGLATKTAACTSNGGGIAPTTTNPTAKEWEVGTVLNNADAKDTKSLTAYSNFQLVASDGFMYINSGTSEIAGISRIDLTTGEASIVAGGVTAPPRYNGSVDGQGTAATMGSIFGMVQASDNNIYFLEGKKLRKLVPSSGQVTTVNATFTTDAGVSTTGASDFMTADKNGNLYYFSTSSTGKVQIFKSNILDGKPTFLAGGATGYKDNTGAAVQMNAPRSGFTSAAGNMYFVDNSKYIRKLSPDGTVTTVFTASTSQLSAATMIQESQNFYVLFAGAVREIDTNNNMKIIAGGSEEAVNGDGLVDGPGSTAKFSQVSNIFAAPSGNKLYVVNKKEILRSVVK